MSFFFAVLRLHLTGRHGYAWRTTFITAWDLWTYHQKYICDYSGYGLRWSAVELTVRRHYLELSTTSFIRIHLFVLGLMLLPRCATVLLGGVTFCALMVSCSAVQFGKRDTNVEAQSPYIQYIIYCCIRPGETLWFLLTWPELFQFACHIVWYSATYPTSTEGWTSREQNWCWVHCEWLFNLAHCKHCRLKKIKHTHCARAREHCEYAIFEVSFLFFWILFSLF